MNAEFSFFKEGSGKWHSRAAVELQSRTFWGAVDEIRTMLLAGKRPGLVDGYDFDVHVLVYGPDGPLPHLFVRGSDPLRKTEGTTGSADNDFPPSFQELTTAVSDRIREIEARLGRFDGPVEYCGSDLIGPVQLAYKRGRGGAWRLMVREPATTWAGEPDGDDGWQVLADVNIPLKIEALERLPAFTDAYAQYLGRLRTSLVSVLRATSGLPPHPDLAAPIIGP